MILIILNGKVIFNHAFHTLESSIMFVYFENYSIESHLIIRGFSLAFFLITLVISAFYVKEAINSNISFRENPKLYSITAISSIITLAFLYLFYSTF